MDNHFGLLLGLFLALLLLAGLAFVWSWRQRLGTGLPPGQVVYSDTGAWKRCEEPLYSVRYHLTGKPDYVVQDGQYRIPIEVKPGKRAKQPFLSDIFQLAAYCLLVEETYSRPPYGLIRYQEDTFRIVYTPRLRAQLISLLPEIRRQRQARDVPPNHDDPQRCLRCGYREVCERKLA